MTQFPYSKVSMNSFFYYITNHNMQSKQTKQFFLYVCSNLVNIIK